MRTGSRCPPTGTATPCFPAWVSGHATFAGAWAGVMRRYFGTDQIGATSTTVVELTTEDPHATSVSGVSGGGFKTRTFTTFSQAARENALSRLYLGVHFRFDGDRDGLALGDHVAAAVTASPGLTNGLGPTGVVWREEQHVFTRGQNGTLEHYRFAPGAGVSHDRWGGYFVGNPSGFASASGGVDRQLHVMARDGEGKVQHYWWDVNVPSTIHRDPWAGPAIVSDPTGFE
ncbi:phosphatase PAP2 family protein [Saccharothrix sp. NRRL B-16348]|uniref:phosphatase PAP2 family protein n=1 Tax=Saccharothrix sp. NRRL B-16348 TaxID=1415542 RepID=UPI0012F9F72C|nr:phosphatase PAP2 family protein [Saccharothrix sp. NRRL B-16348]